MYTLTIRRIKENKIEKTELKHIDDYNNLSKNNKDILINSLNRKKVGILSFGRSKYQEGRIMSKADKKSSRKEIKNISSAKALLTGKNKKIK
jgi:hypothetical protein